MRNASEFSGALKKEIVTGKGGRKERLRRSSLTITELKNAILCSQFKFATLYKSKAWDKELWKAKI